MSKEVSMEMRASCVEVKGAGAKLHMLVHFSDEDGNKIDYPWESLKKVVLEWIKIEEGDE